MKITPAADIPDGLAPTTEEFPPGQRWKMFDPTPEPAPVSDDPRTPCAVPYCAKSKKGSWAWWLCREHYTPVPMWVRARHRRIKAYFKRRGEIWVGKKSWHPTSERATRALDAAAREIIRAACNRASGL